MHLSKRSSVLFALLFCVACGGSNANTTAVSAASSDARPSCEAIDEACDPHEDEGGLAKECHDLAEAKATTEAVCASRKTECLAACPAKKKS